MIQGDKLILSPYIEIYDLVVPKNHILRKIKEVVDFSFVDDILSDKYCHTNGRPGYKPQKMFKYLILKCLYELSDADLVERAMSDMAFKYFLDLAPEDQIIDSSSLTVFRKKRLTDEGILDFLISKTVEIAIQNGINLTNRIIADSTHTNSRYHNKSPREILIEESKKLRQSVYKVNASYKNKMPKKRENTGLLEDQIKYCNELINLISDDDSLMIYDSVKTKVNFLKEIVEDDVEHLNSIKEKDAKIGHKTADTNFFGYKTHIAMTPERIITAATVTTGEKHDGKELQKLVEKTEENGIKIEAFIGDKSYSERDNILYSKEKKLKLVSQLSSTVTEGNSKSCEGFFYNKDAERMVCPEGHLAYKLVLNGKKANKNNGAPLREIHFFDIDKCKTCCNLDKCKIKPKQKSKSYCRTIKKDTIHQEHIINMEKDEYKELAKERYMIEAKNAELKNNHGYKDCTYSGLFGMRIQAAVSIFTVNIKRILTLIGE